MSDRPLIAIAEAASGDAGAIAALHSASWRDAYAPLLPVGALPDSLEAEHVALWDKVLFASPRRVLVLTASQSGVLQGFAALCADPDDDDLDYLAALHVRPGQRSSGLGARLLLALAKSRRRSGRQRLWCWVLRENAGGRRFYAALGATEGVSQTVPLTETTDCVDIRLDFPPWAELIARCEARLAGRLERGG
ncbi:MAG: GNAT family N-acetyltransferase [Pseudomonadota bacterium]